MTYQLDREKFLNLARDNKAAYQGAQPFPNIVIDNVFPPDVLDRVLEEFPRANDLDWIEFANPFERKLASRGEHQFGPNTRTFLHLLNSQIFVEFLEGLTGIPDLIPDPTFDGGGLHQILPGGLLKIHADFNKHPRTKLDRRLNVLIYLNKDWDESYGGHFELWDREMKKAGKRSLPVFNRMAIFSTTDFSYHGHPEPLKCPPDRSRKSLALYYYSNGRPAEETNPGEHTTLFQLRPQERGKLKYVWGRMRIMDNLVGFFAPIALKTLKALRGRK